MSKIKIHSDERERSKSGIKQESRESCEKKNVNERKGKTNLKNIAGRIQKRLLMITIINYSEITTGNLTMEKHRRIKIDKATDNYFTS